MIDARSILGNAVAFRYYLRGPQRQGYVAMLMREYEKGLEDLSPMTSNAWFHYVEYKSNGFFASAARARSHSISAQLSGAQV